MFKIIILILLALIIYFFVRTRKVMSKIDTIYNKDDVEKIKQIQLEIQKRLGNKKKKPIKDQMSKILTIAFLASSALVASCVREDKKCIQKKLPDAFTET